LAPITDDTSLLLQQAQLQQEQQQREIQLRQLLLREQLEQLQEQEKLRTINHQTSDYPDLQQRFQNFLLGDHLQRSPATQQTSAYLREQAALRSYEEQLRRKQEELDKLKAEERAPASDEDIFVAAVQRQRLQQQLREQQLQQLREQQQQLQQQQSHLSPQTSPPLAAANSLALLAAVQQAELRRESNASMTSALQRPTEPRSSLDLSSRSMPAAKRAKTAEAPSRQKSPPERAETSSPASSDESESYMQYGYASDALEKIAAAADMVVPEIVVKGTIQELLESAESLDEVDNAASALVTTFADAVEWSDSEKAEKEKEHVTPADGIIVSRGPAKEVSTPSFHSSVPHLPEEPVFEEDVEVLEEKEKKDALLLEDGGDRVLEKSPEDKHRATNGEGVKTQESKARDHSAVLEYPYPVDTWWPSMSGLRRERRSAGETSDEDDFEEAPLEFGQKPPNFRANEQKIRARLSTALEPGVAEKLPHCRIHRVRDKRKKYSTAPDLVYCWQVTELYPNEIMVNCSRCGTWRHAACGGHYKAYSTRENTEEPFVAVCEVCAEEERFLAEFPHAEKRVERQRMEQVRRGLATSAVMRHASYSKHGGTYKWPLGSVSGTHIGGHTRSVHARHDKAEKQWNDMAARLTRGYGYRQKERVRSRTKELERLLVSIEDAEGYTERHNMLLFLLRDTAKEKPVGFDHEIKNIFDPAEDGFVLNAKERDDQVEGNTDINATVACEDHRHSQDQALETAETCARIGCERKHRFDSQFCSNACGVAAVEQDLLRTLQDASDIHPSVLRL
jgi:hypothetical protein